MQSKIRAPDSFDKYYKGLSDYKRGKFDATVNNTIGFSIATAIRYYRGSSCGSRPRLLPFDKSFEMVPYWLVPLPPTRRPFRRFNLHTDTWGLVQVIPGVKGAPKEGNTMDEVRSWVKKIGMQREEASRRVEGCYVTTTGFDEDDGRVA